MSDNTRYYEGWKPVKSRTRLATNSEWGKEILDVRDDVQLALQAVAKESDQRNGLDFNFAEDIAGYDGPPVPANTLSSAHIITERIDTASLWGYLACQTAPSGNDLVVDVCIIPIADEDWEDGNDFLLDGGDVQVIGQVTLPDGSNVMKFNADDMGLDFGTGYEDYSPNQFSIFAMINGNDGNAQVISMKLFPSPYRAVRDA